MAILFFTCKDGTLWNILTSIMRGETYRLRRFAHEFYSSTEWINCRRGYAKSVGGLCERCLTKGLYTPGTQVHHKIRLTWDNLELLCTECHREEHRGRKRWETDEMGHVLL